MAMAMRFTRITLACLCGFTLIVGCAKSDDSTGDAANSPATQPAVGLNQTPQSVTEFPATEPSASLLKINGAPQWFPPACLRLTAKAGKVTARLYSDDPRDVLTGKETVDSFDLMMVLPDISDPADIQKTEWVDRALSMEKQNTPYGIFLNSQHDVLQPFDVAVLFQGESPHVKVVVQGTFGLFHITDQTPHPAPVPVQVVGVLNATVPDAK